MEIAEASAEYQQDVVNGQEHGAPVPLTTY